MCKRTEGSPAGICRVNNTSGPRKTQSFNFPLQGAKGLKKVLGETYPQGLNIVPYSISSKMCTSCPFYIMVIRRCAHSCSISINDSKWVKCYVLARCLFCFAELLQGVKYIFNPHQVRSVVGLILHPTCPCCNVFGNAVMGRMDKFFHFCNP